MHSKPLNRFSTGLLVIDFQEKLFPHVDHACEALTQALKAIEGCRLLNLPILVSEQNPQGLGRTVEPIRKILGSTQNYFSKTAFSCLKTKDIETEIHSLPINQWIIVGLEAHICVLQTARDLVSHGKQAIVLNDAISSRSIYDFSTAIAEMRDFGARITSTETILFELLEDSKDPEFKSICHLIKKS